MKTSRSPLLLLAGLSFLGLLSVSCLPTGKQLLSDIPIGERAVLTLRCTSSDPQTRGFTVNDQAITDLNAFVYMTNGAFFEHHYMSGNQCQVTLIANNHYNIFVIANTGKSLASIQDLQALLSYRHTLDNISQTVNAQGALLLCGREMDFYLEHDTSHSLRLERCAARIVVQADLSALDSDTQIDFTRVSLRNVPTGVQCFGNSSIQTAQEAFAYGETRQGEELNGLYGSGISFHTFENRQGNLLENISTPSQKILPQGHPKEGLCTYLELEGSYQSTTQRGDILYRIYLGSDALGNFDVIRNTLYKVTLFFEGSGVNEVSWRIQTSGLENRPLDISLTPDSHTFESYGERFSFQVQFTPEDIPSAWRGLSWYSDNPDVARVNTDGTVTAVSHGQCRLLVLSTDNPSILDTAWIQVVRPIRTLSLTPLIDTLYHNVPGYDTLVLNALPSGDYTALWRWEGISLTRNGNRAVARTSGAGAATITAIHPDDTLVQSTSHLTILQPVIAFASGADSTAVLRYGRRTTIQAVLLDGAPNSVIHYESASEAIATVSQTGVVTAIKEGMTRITLSAPGAQDKYFLVGVYSYNGDDFEFITLEEGASQEIDYCLSSDRSYFYYNPVTDSYESCFNYTYIHPNIEVIFKYRSYMEWDRLVVFKGKSAGFGVVKNDKNAYDCKTFYLISVTASSSPKTFLLQDSLSLTVGESRQVDYSANPTLLSSQILWSVQPESVATISNGTITAHAEGIATLSAIGHNITQTCQVRVLPAEVQKPVFALAQETYFIYPGITSFDTVHIAPPVIDTENTSGPFRWSVSPYPESAFSWHMQGDTVVIQAFATGRVDLTCTHPQIDTLVCFGDVITTSPKVIVWKDSLRVRSGAQIAFGYLAVPESNPSIVSSDNNIAYAYDYDYSLGFIKGVSPGNCTLSLSHYGIQKTFYVTVYENTVPSVPDPVTYTLSLNPTTVTLYRGVSGYSSAWFNASPNENGTTLWSCSPNTIATLTADGNNAQVFAEAQSGTATITATHSMDATVNATASVWVKDPVFSVEMPSYREMHLGEVLTLSPHTEPEAVVDWSSSDEQLVSVSGNTLTALATGTGCIISGTLYGTTRQMEVAVFLSLQTILRNYPEQGHIELQLGNGEIGGYHLLKNSAYNDINVFYSSQDENVATVDATGRIWATGAGSTNIVITQQGAQTPLLLEVVVELI